MLCTAVDRDGGAPPDIVIINYMEALIRMNVKREPINWAEIKFDWMIYDESDGEEPQAVLAFRDQTVAMIALAWDTSEYEVQRMIADSLLQSINEQYEMSCTT